MPLQDHEVTRALEIARAMAAAGIPIFVAAPLPGSKVGFALPDGWEHTEARASAVDQWRPGWALCAVGGHACDFIDVDPRNGGTESAERLWQAGSWPASYGQAATPSGGIHEIIQPLRVGKGELVAGVDLQGGRPDGGGRGFVFIAPTVRASKVDGIARPYRWLTEPDLLKLAQWRGETSGAGLARLLPVRKTKVAKPDEFYADADDTPHTTMQADRCIAGKGADVTAAAQRGWGEQFRAALNRAAYTLGAYVGSGYMSEGQATEHLCSSIRLAGHEPDDDDLRWIAEGIEDGAAHPIRVVRPFARTAAAGDTEGFGARLIDAADLDELPDPEPLVKGWLYQNTIARIVGQPGAYKSFVSLDMALCVALGRPWHGRPVEQTPVLYVVGEGLAGYKLRVAAWCEHHGVKPEELRGKLLLTRQSVQIGGEHWPGLMAWVVANTARLVVVDTQARATIGAEENSNTDQGIIVEHCNALRAAVNGVLLLVHHTGHANGEAAERGRGASAWRAAVDTELLVSKTGEYTGALKCDRQKDAESGQEVSLRLRKVGKSLVVQIAEETPLSPRSQWIVDQVAAGVRFESAAALIGALRVAGHKASNTDKPRVFEEYHAAVRKIIAEGYEPGAMAVDPGENPFQ